MNYKKMLIPFLMIYIAFSSVAMGMKQAAPSDCIESLHEGKIIYQLGGSVVVRLVHNPCTGDEFVCKYPVREDLSFEVEIMSHLPKSPFLVQYKGFSPYKKASVLFMEYVAGGNFDQFIKQTVRTVGYFKSVEKFFVQLMMGLYHLHRSKIVHLDINPANLLIGPYGNFKIADFGLAEAYESEPFNIKPLRASNMAPELSKGGLIDCKVDCWAAGWTLSIALNDTLGVTPRGKVYDVSADYDGYQEMKKLKEMLLQEDPAKRPSAFEVLCMPYMQHCLALVLQDVVRSENVDFQQEMMEAVSTLLDDIRSRTCVIERGLAEAREALVVSLFSTFD